MLKTSFNRPLVRLAQHVVNQLKQFITIRLQLKVMDYRSYMKKIQSALEKIKAADKIQESPWKEVVVRELNEISKDCAKELQTETGQIGNKGDYQLGLDEWPPTRILSLMLALSAWVGWIMHEKHGSSEERLAVACAPFEINSN